MGRNIVFKCTYNNGVGYNKYSKVGYKGTCSNEIIKWNIEKGKIWCNEGPCKKYYRNNFRGIRPKSPCYESNLFDTWYYDAGWDHKNLEKPRKIRQAGIGNLAILTTRFPGDEEKDRKIIGFYRIGDVIDNVGRKVIATKIIADDIYRIKLSSKESEQLLFWDYYKNINSPEKCLWGTGLFRYIDMEILDILKKAQNIVEEDNKIKLINELYEYYLKVYERVI